MKPLFPVAYEKKYVGFLEGVKDLLTGALVEKGFVLTDEPSRIDKGEALFVPLSAGIIPVPGNSRQVIDQGPAAFAYPVEKSGFADVRSSNDCNDRHQSRLFNISISIKYLFKGFLLPCK